MTEEYEELAKKLEDAKVIRYMGEFGEKYFITEYFRDGTFHGRIATSTGTDTISIDKLIESDAVVLVPQKE